jgi:hypothetical protein
MRVFCRRRRRHYHHHHCRHRSTHSTHSPSVYSSSSFFSLKALDAVPRSAADWRKTWRFTFKGEPARDAGGVAREFWTLLSEQLFHPHAGLFMYSATDNLCYQINPLAPSLHGEDTAKRMFRVTGRLLGKALLDRQLMTVSLNRPLLKHLLALPVAFDDLEQVDAALHQNLKWMLENNGVRRGRRRKRRMRQV